MADNILENFYVSLGFKTNLAGLAAFQGAAQRLQKFLGGLSGAILSFAGPMAEKFGDTIKELGDVGQFARTYGQSANEIYAFGKATVATGGSVEAFEQTVQGLSSTIGQAALGVGRGAKILGHYGITAKNADGSTKSVRQVLSDIAGKMEGLSQVERISMANRLGIDPVFIEQLKLGKKGFDEFYQAAVAGTGMSDEDFALADKVNKGLAKLNAAFGKMVRSLVVMLLPILQPIVDAFTWLTGTITDLFQWVLNQARPIFTALATSAAWLGKQIKMVGDFVKGLLMSREAMVALRVILIALVPALVKVVALMAAQAAIAFGRAILWCAGTMQAFGASLWALATNPITLIIAAVIALFLVIQDLFTYWSGGESLLAPVFDAIGSVWHEMVMGMATIIEALVNAWTVAIAWIETAWEGVTKFLVALFGPVAEWIGQVFTNYIWPVISTVIGWIMPLIEGIGWAFKAAFGVALTAINAVLWAINKVIEGIQDALRWLGILGTPHTAGGAANDALKNVNDIVNKQRKAAGAPGAVDFASDTAPTGPPASAMPGAHGLPTMPAAPVHQDLSVKVNTINVTTTDAQMGKDGTNAIMRETARQRQSMVRQ